MMARTTSSDTCANSHCVWLMRATYELSSAWSGKHRFQISFESSGSICPSRLASIFAVSTYSETARDASSTNRSIFGNSHAMARKRAFAFSAHRGFSNRMDGADSNSAPCVLQPIAALRFQRFPQPPPGKTRTKKSLRNIKRMARTTDSMP